MVVGLGEAVLEDGKRLVVGGPLVLVRDRDGVQSGEARERIARASVDDAVLLVRPGEVIRNEMRREPCAADGMDPVHALD